MGGWATRALPGDEASPLIGPVSRGLSQRDGVNVHRDVTALSASAAAPMPQPSTDDLHATANRHHRLPLTVIERRGARGHQGLERDQVEYCDLARDRQRFAYRLVREHNAIESSRIARPNQVLSDVFHKRPIYTAGSWVWAYNSKLA